MARAAATETLRDLMGPGATKAAHSSKQRLTALESPRSSAPKIRQEGNCGEVVQGRFRRSRTGPPGGLPFPSVCPGCGAGCPWGRYGRVRSPRWPGEKKRGSSRSCRIFQDHEGDGVEGASAQDGGGVVDVRHLVQAQDFVHLPALHMRVEHRHPGQVQGGGLQKGVSGIRCQ